MDSPYPFPLAILVLATAASGCGSLDPAANVGVDGTGGGSAGGTGAISLFPFKAGNTWTYRTTDQGEVSLKVTTIGDSEPVGGPGPNGAAPAFKVVTKKQDGADQTVSWQADLGDKIVRYREQAFHKNTGDLEEEEYWDPYKLRLDLNPDHLRVQASWLEIYQETKLPVGKEPSTATARDRWTILADSDAVTVPAGTFNALVIQRASGSATKTYWFVRGIGKVKETGGQTEELVSYQVSP